VESEIRKNLRELRDVKLVESDWDYELRVIALRSESKGGVRYGYAITSIELTIFKLDFLKRLGEEGNKYFALFGTYPHYGSSDNYALRLVDEANFESTCKEIVAGFDSRTLEAGRKVHQFLEDFQTRK
jgi:hypothetical protein